MDAVDLNWCLACGCRIEMDVCTPYCSQGCLNSDKPSSSALPLPSFQTLPSFVERESIPDEDEADNLYHYDDALPDAQLASPSRNTWIGRGEAGIRAWAQSIPRGMPSDFDEPHSGTIRPKLLLQPCRSVKPSLCMSRAQPAPPEPSRPILTPQQSLPSLSRDSTSIPSASMVSLTTGSSSYSVPTPATTSEVGSLHEAPISRPHGSNNFLGGIKAQFRMWASSSTPQKEALRSPTVTRKDTVRIVEPEAQSFAARNARRGGSPPAFFQMPEQYPQKRSPRTAKENALPASKQTTAEEAYRTRGRRTARITS